MSQIKNDGLDQCGAEPFEQQQFGTAGIEGVKRRIANVPSPLSSPEFWNRQRSGNVLW